MRFKNKTVLITGAASGIGLATARRLASEGAGRLFLVDVDGEALNRIDLPTDPVLVPGDVADEQFWDSIQLGTLDHAVVNAGIAAAAAIVDLSFEEWRRIQSVNLDGAFLTIRAALRTIREGGSIVAVASAAALKAERGIGAYAASKAGLIQLARVAAKEGADRKVRVNIIAPGGVETPIWDSVPMFADRAREMGRDAAFAELAAMATPLKRYAKPEEIAAEIAFLLSDDCASVTGAVHVADGGYTL
jgi:NAD(P)-dependent dehydrogenase (short-subunit alcohol dehydrogenase family)